MALKLTLKPNELVVVNGCAIRNTNRRHVLVIESQADVVRGHDLLDDSDAATPVGRAYFLIQTALVRADLRDKVVPAIQKQLAILATVLSLPQVDRIFEAANFVSQRDYYKALRALRPVLHHERKLLDMAAANPSLGGEAVPGGEEGEHSR